ncbi:hypothetical protein B1757_02710 [Acidithiobacillus marinus]|uniref:Uncharacterized protein n=1 Tax=Acidithiobacillus marinus TaxID=187490 RepID=A0A2I1DPA6_9PROT|nr:hypothetical protein [Acidithiobacillus marinus]PKY11718.1 hypothetical protein B1757_02710 [Acidithiobacillus marinus]
MQHTIEEKDALLMRCRTALDAVLERKPMLGAMYYSCGHFTDTIGNLRAELGKYRADGPTDQAWHPDCVIHESSTDVWAEHWSKHPEEYGMADNASVPEAWVKAGRDTEGE